jgi:hypothetical protein
MKILEKGPLAPAPVLAAPLEPLSQTIQHWPGIIAAAHWDLFRVGEVVDGIDFYLGELELGHLHHDGEAHLATSPALAQALLARHLARPLRWGGPAGWTEYSVRTPADAAHAQWLFQLNYKRLQGYPEQVLLTDIAAYVPLTPLSST